MARSRRIDFEGAMHHVVSRGNNQWPIFLDDVDRRRFLGTLSRVCDRYGIVVVAYCLMDNHFHLILHCPDARLSDAMRDLKSQYARWFVWRHGSNGPRYDSRFFSDVVRNFRQLKHLIRYIHRNPLAIDPTMRLGDYPWSSHAIFEEIRPAPAWLDPGIGQALFTDLRREIEAPAETDVVQNKPRATPPGRFTHRADVPSLAEIRIAVAHTAACDVIDVHPARRNGLIGIALVLAQDHFGYTLAEARSPYNYRTDSAARSATQRARRRLTTDPTIRRTLEAALGRLEVAAA